MQIRSKMENWLSKLEKHFESLNTIEIKRKNLLSNYDFFKKISKGREIWPVLKSNAYGHGIGLVAKILLDRDFKYFVVDGYHEVLEIRKITDRPILMIGTILPENFARIKWENLAIMVQDKTSIRALGKLNRKIKIHLKINTGMNRQGSEILDLRSLIVEIKKYPKLELEGVMSHLAGVDDVGQIKKFEEVLKIVEESGIKIKYAHLVATAGVMKVKNLKINAIRLGIGLYGIGNFGNLKPVLNFKTVLTNLRIIKKGERVSYGGIWEAKKTTNIGVIPVGYNEILDRRLSNKGWVKYKDKFYPIIGIICMNMAVIDLGKTKAKLFDEVEVVSDNPKDKNSIGKMAEIAEMIPYELLVKINSSIRRVVK